MSLFAITNPIAQAIGEYASNAMIFFALAVLVLIGLQAIAHWRVIR